MNILIMFNPNAGKQTGHAHAMRLEKALLKNQPSTVVTKQASPSIEILNKFWAGYKGKDDCVVIIGGDGTIGPVVNAMIKNNVDIPIFCYGKGTANDFASYFKTNRGPRKAAKILLRAKTGPVDTLLVNNDTYACNVACGGAFTNGVTRYHKKSKRLLGKLAYLIPALVKTFKLQNQRLRFTVDEGTFELDVFLFYVLNTTNVGGMKKACAPACINDGKLDLMCLKRCGLFGKMSIAFHQAFGKLHRCPCAHHIQGENFKIEYIDGDEIQHDFTVTDIDGNGGGPYPLNVKVGKKISVVRK
ncbi:MAG: hypothetical protein LBG88_03560 [Christensenellaceae bacterium]|jgi:YegS/Rv2252/BmrU family lipid kinase|nr:hypothetical protein [Christensenellaceae bacterium]